MPAPDDRAGGLARPELEVVEAVPGKVDQDFRDMGDSSGWAATLAVLGRTT